MTIYSIRDNLGQERFWTTSRRKAFEWCAQRNATGLERYAPLAVYKSTQITQNTRANQCLTSS